MTKNNPRHGILLVNLGSPESPTADAIEAWLVAFLSDPDVVDLPRWLWLPLLKKIIAPRRAPALAELYTAIWTPAGSPLTAISQRQARALQELLNGRGHQVQVSSAMRYGEPGLLSELRRLVLDCVSVQILLQYPQFAQSTSGSCLRLIDAEFFGDVDQRLRVIKSYPTAIPYIAALSQSISNHWQHQGRGDHLLISFHGLPERAIRRGDPYQQQCEQTTAALVRDLELEPGGYTLCYQSRFGAARWIGPATDQVAGHLANEGVKRLDVVCPGFAADCLETLEEINVQLRQQFLAAGGERFDYIPALNDSEGWIDAMATLLEPGLLEHQND